MSLEISDDVLAAAELSADEMAAELALLLYKQERLTLAQAARLAKMTRVGFQRFLESRGEYLNLDESDFEQDLRSLRTLGRI
jgi:predicted HTH domain antitoxin